MIASLVLLWLIQVVSASFAFRRTAAAPVALNAIPTPEPAEAGENLVGKTFETFACLGGCSKAARSVSQLQLCGAAAVASRCGATLLDIFECQSIPTEDLCVGVKTTNGIPCDWVPHTEQHLTDFGLGSCMIQEAANGLSTRLGLSHVFEAHLSATAGNIAKPFERAECGLHTWDGKCNSSVTSTKRTCRLCSGLDDSMFPFPGEPVTEVCVISDFKPDSCPYYKLKCRNCLFGIL